MSHGRPTKGIHQMYAYAQTEGQRIITCACGKDYSCFDAETVWAMFLQHTQDPAHR